MKPNIENIKLWIKALRSKKYSQGFSVLREDKNSFCCLGVACDIFRKETKTGEWQEMEKGYKFVTNTGIEDIDDLPDEVKDWYGLEKPEPYIKGKWLGADYNDNLGYSFKKIANLLEKTYIKEK